MEPSPDYPLDDLNKETIPKTDLQKPRSPHGENSVYTNKAFIGETDLFQPAHTRRDSQFSYRF